MRRSSRIEGRRRSPIVRVAAVGVVAVLAAAGFATATFAGKGAIPNNNPPTTTQAPTTTAPPDPLTPPPTGPSSSVTAEMKKEALGHIRSIMVGTAVFLGDCLTPSEGSGPDTTDPVLCFVAAQAIFNEMIAQYKYYKDPPDPNFQQVALGARCRRRRAGTSARRRRKRPTAPQSTQPSSRTGSP